MIRIFGAGIAGTAMAQGLLHSGCEASQLSIHDTRPGASKEGAGIQLSPNALHALAALGLPPPPDAIAPISIDVLTRQGCRWQRLARLGLESFPERFGAPLLTCHRASLHTHLLQAIAERGLEVKWHSSPALPAATGDGWLLMATGISSLPREQQGAVPMAEPAGVALRGLVADVDGLPRISIWMAPEGHAVTYPVGSDKLNVVVCAASQEQANEVLLGLPHPIPTMLMLGSWPLSRPRRPACAADYWQPGQPQMLWLGDAAHPMLPHLAQGAAMALEDAALLAPLIADPSGLHHIAAAVRGRARRVARIQQAADRNGRIFRWGGPMAQLRNLGLKVAGPHLMVRPWLYGHEPTNAPAEGDGVV